MTYLEVEPGQIWEYGNESKWIIVEKTGIISGRYRIFCIDSISGNKMIEYNFKTSIQQLWTRLA